MPHSDRPMMNPQPRHTFDQVYNLLNSMPNKQTSLETTGRSNRRGVDFVAEAKVTISDNKKYIALPHNNRIYPCCWGNAENHMGKEKGQRIRQYARPIDDWATNCLGL